jgi:hypothetical protein
MEVDSQGLGLERKKDGGRGRRSGEESDIREGGVGILGERTWGTPAHPQLLNTIQISSG